jgi:archaellum component FlaD/FlaE
MSKNTTKDTTNHIVPSTTHNKNVPKQQSSTANASMLKESKKDQKDKKHKEHKKDKKQQAQPQLQQRQRIVANNFSELSEDLQDKIRKAKIPEDKINANFRILLNILHFLTKDSFRMHDNSQTPPMIHYRRPYASSKLIEEAST